MAKRRRSALLPRKQPRQERSRATVEAILQATTYILTRSGWDQLTTNAIAERAGVNIASLYQYFPNKAAIVAELRRRHLEQLRGCHAEGPPPKTLHEALSASVETLIRQRKTNGELHRIFEQELPRSSALGLATATSPSASAWDPSLVRHVPDLELAGFVARTAAQAVIDEAASERPALLDSPRFKAELVTLLERYLDRRDGVPPEGGSAEATAVRPS
ncbi:Transcriptional regulator, TetR family [Cystobacter fuscus DSM 2262]|uniref:Transcriptional regulator, TetR family n=1 Tax=Cystobacter fuscus (strain ATCC 25194 / DSM 2262 / NBRC 100088 / M29) TaxID=1242864 RepID=S9NZN4_CYSF2|nr:TetR/AcrR family transcriptional regulator [Cystobacter fuscus]EPX56331.1 Transcriptional regulator, TetR family [Cystobacter fuscus DSM 2262]